jgi:hypothetical protein
MLPDPAYARVLVEEFINPSGGLADVVGIATTRMWVTEAPSH